MRKLITVLLGAFMLTGALGLDASAATAKNQFKYLPSAELGFNGINTAKDDVDPLDSENQVQSVDTDPGGSCAPGPTNTCPVGVITTTFGDRGKRITSLDGKLSIRYLFIDRTCIGGAPRIVLEIDEDGDGTGDANVEGNIGDQPFGGDCPETVWVSEDMTNDVEKWDADQLAGGSQTDSWNTVETLVGTGRVLSVTLADDASWNAGAIGCAYYDDFIAGDRKMDKHNDTPGAGADGSGLNNC